MVRDRKSWSFAERQFVRAELERFDAGAMRQWRSRKPVARLNWIELDALLEEVQTALQAEMDA
jgi:hypothetical protein